MLELFVLYYIILCHVFNKENKQLSRDENVVMKTVEKTGKDLDCHSDDIIGCTKQKGEKNVPITDRRG